jgi:GT2 family glycosyltransferase
MMVRREALDQVGFLDEGYFLFFEETDWCYRMKRAGWKIFHVPQAEVYHFQGKSAQTDKMRARVEFFRSRYHFFKKNRGSLQHGVLLVGLIVRLFVESVFMAVVCFFTLGMAQRCRKKFSTYAYLLWWHLKFCPDGMGLKN